MSTPRSVQSATRPCRHGLGEVESASPKEVAMSSRQNESGTILVVVGLSISVLMLLSVFVVDNGFMWYGRVTAQTAADAGALAGGVGLMYDDATDHSTTGAAYQSAVAGARQNLVAGGNTFGVHVDLDPDTSTWEHSAP